MVDFSYFDSLISLTDYFVDEHTCKVFRWNSRKSSESERFEVMFQRSLGTVRWVDIPLMAA